LDEEIDRRKEGIEEGFIEDEFEYKSDFDEKGSTGKNIESYDTLNVND